jgi:hypothetical protein
VAFGLNKFFSKFTNILVIIFLLNIFERIGVNQDILILKLLTIITWILALNFSLKSISKNYKFIRHKNKWIIFFLVIPLLDISFEILDNISFKILTDAYFIKLQYFFLMLLGLSYSLEIKNNKLYYLFNSLEKYCLVSFVIISSLFIFQIFSIDVFDNSSGFGDTYLALDSCLIPGCFLFFSNNSRHKKVSLFFILITIVLLSYIGSRSYFIVLIVSLFLIIMSNKLKLKSIFRFLVSIPFICFLFLFFDLSKKIEKSFLFQKINFKSLYSSLFEQNHDYAGNSRSGIIYESFYNLSDIELLFGKGFFSTYESFVTRNTIEIGFLQIAFWLGFIYASILLIIHVSSAYKNYKTGNQINNFFAIIIITKVIDSFVYGMPELSVYNFLVAIGIFLPHIRKVNVEL